MKHRGILTLDTWNKGWARTYGIDSPWIGGSGQSSRTQTVSFNRFNRIGCLAPGETLTALADASARVNELPLTAVVGSNGEAFALLKNARLVRFGVGDNVIDNHYDVTAAAPNHAGHTVQTSSRLGEIVVRDLASTPAEYVIRFWEDDVDADAGIISTAGASQDDDWLSTRTASGVLTKGVPLQPAIGPEGLIAFTHGRWIGLIEITGDLTSVGGATITRQKLNLGVGWVASSIVYDQGFFWIVGYRESTFVASFSYSECRLWLWDGRSPNVQAIYAIDDNYVTAVKSDSGVIKVFTAGRHNTAKVWRFTGSKLEIEDERLATFMAPPLPGSIDPFEGSLAFTTGTGNCNIASLDGRSGFNDRISSTVGGVGVLGVGLVRNLSGNGLYVGVQFATSPSATYGIGQINYTGYALNSFYRTDLLTLPYGATTEFIRWHFAQWDTGSILTTKLYPNFATSGDLLAKTHTFAAGARPVISEPVVITDLSAFWMEFFFGHAAVTDTAAILRAVEIGYTYDDSRAA